MRQEGAALLSPLSLSSASVAFTGRAEGDMGHGGRPEWPRAGWNGVVAVRPDVMARRRAVVDLPWTWVRQVHGATVVVAHGPGDGAGATADAVVTTEAGCAVAVLTADCAPVALASPEGVVGVAHAGWRGTVAGVIEATVAEMRALGATEVQAVIGPCIRPACYEFADPELSLVADRLGAGVRGVTAGGRPALDLPAAVLVALDRAGVDPDHVDDVGTCTACSPDHFSWRADRRLARQAAVVWR